MNSQTNKLVILFADISDSTALYENLGDEQARQLVATCLATMSQCAASNLGMVIKTIGDEILCTFPSAETALAAAKEMQRVTKTSHKNSKLPLRVRIGFHFGDVICEAEDVYGDTVNIAARITATTRAGQIMTTLATVDTLPPELRGEARQIQRAELNSKQGRLALFQIPWEGEDMQRTRVGIPAYDKNQTVGAELTLRYRGQSCRVNEQGKKVFLGRGGTCKIVVVNDLTSREHAAVEFRSGNFVLRDNSINGTYIRFDNGETVHLHHEEAILRGIGTISLGKSYSEEPSELVIFSIPTKFEFEI